jgi:hypothetical protein
LNEYYGSSGFTPPGNQGQLQTTGWEGMGPTPVPNPFTQQGQPSWAQGAFAAPWWGMSAANPAQPLTEQDLVYQQPPQEASAPPQEYSGLQYLIEMLRMKEQLRRLDRYRKIGHVVTTLDGLSGGNIFDRARRPPEGSTFGGGGGY